MLQEATDACRISEPSTVVTVLGFNERQITTILYIPKGWLYRDLLDHHRHDFAGYYTP